MGVCLQRLCVQGGPAVSESCTTSLIDGLIVGIWKMYLERGSSVSG